MAIQVVGISIYHISRHFYNIILYVQRSLRNKSVKSLSRGIEIKHASLFHPENIDKTTGNDLSQLCLRWSPSKYPG